MSLKPRRLVVWVILCVVSCPFLLHAKLPPHIQEDHIVKVLAYDPQIKLVLVKAGIYNAPEFKFRKTLISDKAKRKRLNHELNRLFYADADETPVVISNLKKEGRFDELFTYLYKRRDSFVWGRESDEYLHLPYQIFTYCGDKGLHLLIRQQKGCICHENSID